MNNIGIYEIISVVASLVSFLSLIGNIMQFTKKRELSKDLYQLVQTQYNNFYLIARSVTRARTSKGIPEDEMKAKYEIELSLINGVADAARLELINFSRHQLKKEVRYQHPAYPEKRDFDDAVKMGAPPDEIQ